MKIKSILLAGLIALGFMACNNEDVPVVKQDANGALTVKVMPSSNSSTRLIGLDEADALNKPGLAAESVVNLTQVWVFAGTNLDGYGSANGDLVEDVAVSPGPRDIIIIVNGGSLDLNANTSKAAILAAQATAPVDMTNGLLMTTDLIQEELKPGYNYLGLEEQDKDNDWDHTELQTTPVKVTRVNARVAIAGLTVNVPTSEAIVFDRLEDVDVAMFNVPEKSEIFGDAGDLAINDAYLYGEQWKTTENTYVYDPANIVETAAFIEKGIGNSGFGLAAAPYFYVNENTAEDVKEQMLIVVRGKPVLGEGDDAVYVEAEGLYTDADGYSYFPVWVNATKDGYTYGEETDGNKGTSEIHRNTQYNIYLTVTKIGNPTIDPVQEAFLDVFVEVQPWEVVYQDVEW